MSQLFFFRLFAMRRLTLAFCALSIFSVTSYAQGAFVSGSTGADGAFSPTENQTVLLPESGVFNFTTVNIPANVTIRFARNARNTPVTILATGNVTIAGTIDISGSSGFSGVGGLGGPGGFSGGSGGRSTGQSNSFSAGVNGDGPGGGGGSPSSQISRNPAGGGGFAEPGFAGSSPDTGGVSGAGGIKYGLPTLLPLIGGSGGGGEGGQTFTAGAGGGGGGGAVLIASSATIIFPSPDTGVIRISASGGSGAANLIGSGGGSGGAVRLIANVISGSLRIDVSGGPGGSFGGRGAAGYIRLEAFDLHSLNLVIHSAAPRVTMATPGVAIPSNSPTIRIVSVAGIAPPNQPNGSLQGAPDIILPTNQSNPVNVALAASNIPLGTTLQVTLTPENGARVVAQSTALTGTLASSTATASVTIPDGISVIQASGTIDVSALGLVVNGEQVKTIEVNAVFGGKQTITYVTASNKRIKVDQ